jgi:phosphate transport system substrate-binding protein
MKNSRKILFLVAVAAFILNACNTSTNNISETPTRGNINISVDESYQLLLDTEIYTFQSLYKYAKINPGYKSEGDVIEEFMNDSVRTIVVSRKLTQNEEDVLRSKSIIPRTTKIAYDALGFIVNKKNQDSLFKFDQITDIFNGTITQWKQLDPKSSLQDLIVVFDNNNSGNVRYIREKFNIKDKFPANCFAVKSNPEVISYVEKHENAIGIIGVNWISDIDDSISIDFVNRIKIVSVENPSNGKFSKPYQGYIAEGSYPLIRDVYMICRETFTGLGSGFVQFVSGDQGQRIVLKSGLVPATMPVRLIEINNN